MKVHDFSDIEDGERYDFVVVGSGFGGSVSALRLAEKGYRVAVLEAGRYYRDEDYARTNWRLDRWLWLPHLFLHGIQRLTFLRHVLILSGAGVGGGSLVYANTLLEPGEEFYSQEACRRLAPDLRERLAPHYATARRMLGVARNPRLYEADRALAAIAGELGRAGTVHSADVGVFFGEPGKTVADPFFGGRGPERAGCVFCGGCMVGCPHNAKNTLVKNYLWLAEKAGARIFALTLLRRLEEAEGGWRLTVSRPGWGLRKKTLRADRVVLSAGVLGTLRILLEHAEALRLPASLGRSVRTNSEVLNGATTRRADLELSQGVAITSGFYPDKETHIELVRYPAGSDAMNLLALPETGSGPLPLRLLRLAWFAVRHPLDFLRTRIPFGWARRTIILLVMSTKDSRLRVRLGGLLGLTTEPDGPRPPSELPIASEVLRRLCERLDAVPQVTANDALLGLPTTAHILGGAVMAAGPEEGVVDLRGKVFGREDLWVLDGSVIPGNPGVNPSLTITALAEHAMAQVPPKS